MNSYALQERSKKQPFTLVASAEEAEEASGVVATAAQGSRVSVVAVEEDDDDDDEEEGDVIDLEELTFTTLRSEFGWKWKNAPLVSGDTWHLFRPGVDKDASSVHSDSVHKEKNLHW